MSSALKSIPFRVVSLAELVIVGICLFDDFVIRAYTRITFTFGLRLEREEVRGRNSDRGRCSRVSNARAHPPGSGRGSIMPARAIHNLEGPLRL
jgi:hypothetical protein